MRTAFRIVIGACILLSLAAYPALAQETRDANDGTPGPALSADDSAAATAEPKAGAPANRRSSTTDDNQWRYRQHDGRWWYWLPSNRWVLWQDGRWVDPPTESIAAEHIETPQYQTAPQYVTPAPRHLQPRPQSWYYADRVYNGPRYYYDEFYEPYGGDRPHPYYPVPRPSYYGRGYYGGYPTGYGGYPYGYGGSGVGVSVGGGRSAVRIGIGF